MTIQEAIRSGRRFKLTRYHNWCSVNTYGEVLCEGCPLIPFSSELLSDDWEVEEEKEEEKKRELSWEEIEYALTFYAAPDLLRLQYLAKRLGFGEGEKK